MNSVNILKGDLNFLNVIRQRRKVKGDIVLSATRFETCCMTIPSRLLNMRDEKIYVIYRQRKIR